MSDKDTEAQLYGRGWKFPLTFRVPPDEDEQAIDPSKSLGVEMSSGADNVERSLRVLFQTQPGERIMRDAYGCDMQSAVFENVSEGMLSGLRRGILESVARNEPRAEVLTVDIQPDLNQPGLLCVNVAYRLAGQERMRQIAGTLGVQDGAGGGF
ncbi:GPW/gp25 family protein [Burkholderia stagnalis]|uniref:GPW/gp25 family protein n=1 Tax=Burkholderia stagnalis TaxID=1503054 RepID=UPI00075F11C3|nr:GPW/gp25 family protein [Burkholderia stagnalis]KWI28417.1 hypothetical protein WT71_16270 [Burkholderia stagnalis]KWI71004.1 hypothetical protein WT73_14055 [Burkholderia stagnalis]MDY7806688.1 GPW/gp25 family protein [Burkholderia stagnalis]